MSELVLASGASPETPSELYVLFRVADAEYALPAHTVLQMESFTTATDVPGTAPYVAGIIQIRGRVVPVVDLRIRFGLPRAEVTLDTRVVVGQHADRAVALLTDSAREVVKIAPTQLKPPPRLLDDGANGYVRAVAQLGPRMIMIVDFSKIIGEEPLDVVQR